MSAASALEGEGRLWFRRALDEQHLAVLDRACAADGMPGARLKPNQEFLEALVAVNAIACDLLPGARPVRFVAFNKSEDANWGLPWHQDRVVALRDRVEAVGYENWTRKSGIWHAEPPIGLLDDMLFARVHLDAATEGNGCLELAVGSHRRGKVEASEAAAVATSGIAEKCVAERGDVLFAKALILHRSGPSMTANSRRALRIDYCSTELPGPLAWAGD